MGWPVEVGILPCVFFMGWRSDARVTSGEGAAGARTQMNGAASKPGSGGDLLPRRQRISPSPKHAGRVYCAHSESSELGRWDA